ncbi:autotransporter-associated beta strand repeat-containing protein [Anatilimnocola sp. NA78]|uniref:autotransporter-associated beta strand repeat-containing protein n=1 Tax=Anatilimnocola sp. NA78 TaxID=3415683 RepID=UPI003CE45408
MLNRSTRSLWSRFLGRKARSAAPAKQRRRSFFEPLEGRQLLASFTWLGTASTDWANQANWDIGDASPGDDGVPGAADSALINDVANDPLLDSARSLGALSGAGIINLGANTLTVGALNTSTAFNGTMSGTGGLTKSGTGTLTLGGANSYSGTTTVDNGTLTFAVDQTLAGGVAFGATNGSTTVGTLNLNSANATFGGQLVVRTNTATPNQITVGSGKLLSVGGGMALGYDAGSGSGIRNSNLTVSGLGGMAVTGADVNISVNQAATNAGYFSASVFDATGLGSFSANLTGNFNVGVGTTTTGRGTANLSNTANTIIATAFQVGHSGGNNGNGDANLVFGTGTNVIRADSFNVGLGKIGGTAKFLSQAAASPGTLSISNKAGSGAANMTLGSHNGTGTAAVFTGTLDVRGHVVTVNAATVTVGNSNANATGIASGVISFDAGTFAAATLNLGLKSSTGINVSPNSGVLNINGGAFSVSGTTTIAGHSGGAGAGAVSGTLNLSNGSFTTGSLLAANKSGAATNGPTANINVSGGALTVNPAGTFNLGINSNAAAAAAVANLTITGGTVTSNVDIVEGAITGPTTSTITLNGGTLDLAGKSIGAANPINTLSLQTGTLKNVLQINNGAAITKTTAGTLNIDGTNGFTGLTTISAGTLGGTGSTGPLTIDVGGTHNPGNSPGLTTVNGNYTENGTLVIELDSHAGGPGVGYDQVRVIGGGSVTLGAASILNIVDLAGTFLPTLGQVFKLIDNDGGPGDHTGLFSNVANNQIFVIDGQSLQFSYNGGDGNDVVLVALTGAPQNLYINDEFVAGVVDGDLEAAGTQTATVGVDAFASFSAAFAAYPNYNGTIIVNGGNYATANLAAGGGGDVTLRLVQDPINAEPNVSIQNLTGDANDAIITRFHNVANANLIVEQGSFTGIVSGQGGIEKNTAGTLNLQGNNTYSGVTTINGGVIEGLIGGTVAAPTTPFGTSSLVINGGQARYTRTNALDAGLVRTTRTGALGGNTVAIDYDGAGGVTAVDTQINRTPPSNEGSRWVGLMQVTSPGNYTFRTRSDDGSRLYINGVLVVSNDGGHGQQDRTSIPINLSTGLHTVTYYFAEGSAGGGGLARMVYSGPDTANAFVTTPTSVFFQSAPIAQPNSVTVTAAGGGIDVTGNVPGLSLPSLNIGAAGSTNFAVTAASGRRVNFAATNLQANGATVNFSANQFVGLGIVSDGANTGLTFNNQGSGQVILDNTSAAANDLSGTTLRLTNGRLVNMGSGAGGATSPLDNAPLIEIAGGTLTLDSKLNSYTIANPITVTSSGVIEVVPGNSTIVHSGLTTINAAQSLTVRSYGGTAAVRGALLQMNGQITGAGDLIKTNVETAIVEEPNTSGSGFLRVTNNANNYSGTTTVSGGVLITNVANGLGATSGDTLVLNGAQLRIEGTTTIGAGETITIAGSGPGAGGALRSEATSVITDKVLLSAAATIVSNTASLTLTGGLDVTNGTVTIDGGGATTLPAGTGTITASANSNGLIKLGSGALTLNATSNYTGSTTINAGTISIAADNHLGTAPGALTNHLILNGGTLQARASFALNSNRGVQLNGASNSTIAVTAGNTLTIGGAANIVNGTGNLAKTDTGTLVLSSGNNFTGYTTVSAGTLRVQDANSLGGISQGTTINSGAALVFDGNFTAAAEPILAVGAGTGFGAVTATGNVTLPGSVGITGDTTIGHSVSGSTLTLAGSFGKESPGNLTFVGAGNVTVAGSIGDADYTLTPFTARVYNVATLPSISTAANVDAMVQGTYAPAAAATVSVPGALTFGSDAIFSTLFGVTLADNYVTLFFSTLTVNTAGTYTVAATGNDDAAAVWLDADGTPGIQAADLLQSVGNGNTVPATKFLNPGTYTLVYVHRENTSGSALTGRLQGPTNTSPANAALLRVVTPSLTTTGTNNLVLNGQGTVTLSGANTYSGTTTVNSGTLLLSGPAATLGSGAAGTEVKSGATLALAGGVVVANEAITLDGIGAPTQLGALVNVSGNNSIATSSSLTARAVNLGEVRLASIADSLTIDADINLESSRLSADGAGDIVINGDISGLGMTVGTPLAAGVSNVFADVPEASGYSLALEHNNLPSSVNGAANFPYTLNNTTSIGAFDRIAYYLELEGGANAPTREFVYVSMDAFTSNINQIGVPAAPTKWAFQQFVSNMNVFASANSGVTNGTGLATGNIEIWPSNYNGTNSFNVPNASSIAGNAGFDFGDGGFNTSDGHGSFQIHNFDLDGAGPGTVGETLIAYNQWRNANPGLGIGTNPAGATSSYDWTFVNNLSSYSLLKRMTILVREVNPSFRQSDNSLLKQGAGTLTLTGTNTYTGTTSVNAGVLAVNNGVGTGAILDTAGPVNVALGATLQLLASETVSSYVGTGDGVGSNDSLLALGANTLTTVGDATIANVSTAAGGGIVAGGAIIDGDDDNNVTGPNVFLQAATGIGAGNTLETSVSAIQLFNTTSGEINVLNSVGGLLTVSDLRTLGFGARNDGGATTVVNSSPLTIAANSISAGNVTFTATDDNDAPALDDDLTINGGVTVGSTTANVFLNAGDDAIINGNVSAALQVTIGVDVGDAELPAGTDATTGGVLTIANAAVITTPLAGVGGGTYLNGNDDHDTFNLAPQSTTEFFINGNLPVGTSPGDTLNLDIATAVNPLLTLGGIGAGTWTFGVPLRQVVYTSIEDVNANAPYHLALDANNTPFGNTGVDDHLTLSRSGTDFVLSRTGDAIAPDDNDVGIVFQGDFATILSFTYLGSNDRDFLTINDLGGLVNFSGLAPGAGDNTNLAGQAEFFFDGGGNNDTLIFALTGPSASQTYAFGTNSGSTPSNTGEVLSSSNAVDLQTYFANVELVQRTGAGATPGALTVLGSDVADALSIAANLADTRVSMGVGYTPFDFSGDNFTSLNVNALAGADSLNLVSLGSGQTNDPAINLHGQGLFADDGAVDTLRVQSTSGNTGVVTLRGGLGGDLFQLFDAAPTVDFIAGPVVVDGSGGDMTFAVDRLEINDSGDLTGDTVALNALNGTDPDYVLTGLNASGVTFRNIDNLDYTGTSDADNINSQLTPTTTPHDLDAVILRGNGGNDQFRVFTSDQIGGTSPLPSGLASGVTSVSLFGDAGLDTFGETPAGLVGTGAMNVGLVVAPTTQLIRPSTTTAITINGGIPTNPLPAPVGDIIGDTLNLDITSIPNTAPVVVAAGSSGVLNSAGQPVAWSEIEDLNLVDQGKLTNVQVGDLFARTTAANDLIQFSRNNTVAQPHRVRLRINSTFGDYNVSNKTIVYAGDGADYVTQANLTVSAEFYGEGGNDLLYGATNNDWLVGGLDNDSVNGGNGDNVLWGDNAPASTDVVPPQDSPIGGNDTLSGGTGNDVIYGGGGNDRLGGFDSNDYLHGGFGDDIADGGFGDDRVYGGAGNDQLAGYLGNDLLVGEAGNDILNGGSGNDVLIGGTGEDNMSGEFGNDLLITGSVANEHSTWTSVASVGPFSAATYSSGTDNDAALLALLNIWGTSNLRTGLATITHDGVDDDVYGKLGDDDFCWEAADVADQGPTALSPPDFQVPGNGTDERFGPTM